MRYLIYPLFSLLFLSQNCSTNKDLPKELYGTWISEQHKITVRTKPGGDWKFTSGIASIHLEIDENNTASGSIGDVTFKKAIVRTNWSLLPVSITGTAFIIEIGSVGKLFEDDPVDGKEIQFWLSPIENGVIHTEVRLTESMDRFPMAGMDLVKIEN